jgi:hypothetical protein
MSSKKTNHEWDVRVKWHNPADPPDEAGCLTSHEWGTTSKDTCAYRWQALQRAKIDHAHYDGKGKGATWDVGYTREVKDRGVVENFRSSAKTPYAHASHHILPQAQLNQAIDQAADQRGDDALWALMRISLLEVNYNINHSDNMMILPTKIRTTRVVGLPQHNGNHSEYSTRVRAEVELVVDEYAALLDKATSDGHPPAPGLLAKEMLENISKEFRDKIFASNAVILDDVV